MLSSSIMRIPLLIDKRLYNYCRTSTENSIRKMTEKLNLERTYTNIKNPLDDDNSNNNPNFNLNVFSFFLSVVMVSLCFYKRLK